ncbi:MAG: urocanate hydratase [Planctomycetes bacterium]|nr:urocanate hydratase [Planctomycetota bacterium]
MTEIIDILGLWHFVEELTMSREYMPIISPTGTKTTCKSWLTEGLMRMFMNMFNPEIASDPENLIIDKDSVQAVRDWETFDEIVNELKILEADETLVIQSGKPVGIFQTHMMAPRVLITNSMFVCDSDYREVFSALQKSKLTLNSGSTVGSWTYSGFQGSLAFFHLLYKQIANKHFDRDLSGKIVLSTGLKNSLGVDAVAANMLGATFLTCEEDVTIVEELVKKGFIQHELMNVDIAINKAFELKAAKKPESIVYIGKPNDLLKAIVGMNLVPKVVTDNSLIDRILDIDTIKEIRTQVRYLLQLQDRGAIVFDSGNGIRHIARGAGLKDASKIPGCFNEYIRDEFCEGKGALKWTALSGNLDDIKRIDNAVLEAYPDNEEITFWIKKVQKITKFSGLPTRVCWLGHGERRYIASVINKLVRDEELSAPVMISRESIDSGSVVNPKCITENMNDKSDAISDWVFLNSMLNTASGATLVSIQQTQGVCGNSINTGIALVANGSPETDKRIGMVFANDQGLGIMRYADAGYEKAIHAAVKYGLMTMKNNNGDKLAE